MKPIVFSDIDGVLTSNTKLHYVVDKPLFDKSTVPTLSDSAHWRTHPGVVDENQFDPVRNQEDWESESYKLSFHYPPEQELRVAKAFSDKDSYIIWRTNQLKNCKIILISCDSRVNWAWAHNHNVEFIHCQEGQDKYDLIQEYMDKHKLGNKYRYIGDAMPDFAALNHAMTGYVPANASRLLVYKLLDYIDHSGYCNISFLKTNGGDGVLDEVYTKLLKEGVIKDGGL